MAKIPDLDKTARENPDVDPEQVKEAQELVEELRKEGFGKREYDLASPFESTRIHRDTEG